VGFLVWYYYKISSVYNSEILDKVKAYKNCAIFLDHPVHCVSKNVQHTTINNNFNSSCPIPVIFGTNIYDMGEYTIEKWVISHFTCLVYIPYIGKL